MIWAAFFNFIAFVVFPLHVAHTIGKGIIDPKIVDDAVLFGALGGAIAWNLITWWYGLPSSSSHALVGGLIGAGFCKGGLGGHSVRRRQDGAVHRRLARARDAAGRQPDGADRPGCFAARHPGRIDRWFRRLQFVSAALFSLGHGANDAQKTMGIIMALLIAKGYLGPNVRRAALGDPRRASWRWGWARCRAAGAS